LPALLTMIVYLVSTLFSLVPFTSFIGSYQRLQGTFTLFGYLVLFFAIITSLRTREQLSRLMTVLILNSLPVALYGIIQHNGLDPLPWAGDVKSRVASNMGNAIFVAAYLIMIVPLTIARIAQSFGDILSRAESRFSDILRASAYIFLLAVQLLTIWHSGSRGPWLGMIAAGFLFPYLALLLLQKQALAAKIAGSFKSDLVKGAGFGLGVLAATGLASLITLLPLPGNFPLYLGGGLAVLVFGGLWLYFIVERKGWRWLWISWGVIGLALALGLLFVNIPGPLQARVSAVPELRRLTTITDLQSGTAKVRSLIWQGTVELITPHQPLEFPDGQKDKFNVLRPWLGYGPESMYVAYNSFYPPLLGHYESRTASPDRSHNETLDSLAITGALGFAAYLFTFISVFYWGFRWLGLLNSRKQLWIYLILVAAFFALFFVIAWRIEGAYLFAVAVPLGVLVGTMVYLTVYAFGSSWRSFSFTEGTLENTSHGLLIVGILTAVIAHFVEINFGIAIAATRTTFWALAGLLVVLGQQWVPALMLTTSLVSANASAAQVKPKATKSRHAPSRRKSSSVGATSWVSAVLALSLIAVFLLSTLAFDFVNNPKRATDPGEIFMQSLTMKYHPKEQKAYGALMIFIFTFALFGLIGLSEYARENLFPRDRGRSISVAIGLYALVALFGLLIFGSAVAGHQARLTQMQPSTIKAVVEVAETLADLLNHYYVLIFTLLVFVGFTLLWEERLPIMWGHPVSLLIGGILLVPGFFVIRDGCSNLIRADIIYKQGGVFANDRNVNQKQIAIEHYKTSLSYVPKEDYYNLFLGKAYLELTQALPVSFNGLSAEQQTSLLDQLKTQVDWASLSTEQQEQQTEQWKLAWEAQQKVQQDTLFDDTEDVLTHARELNPLNTDHSANLARFYKSWAARVVMDMRAPDLSEQTKTELTVKRDDLLEKALINYNTALTLSPNNPIIWNEKAQLYAIDMQNMVMFHETITRSLQVDEGFEQTWMLLGDMLNSKGHIDAAIDAYEKSLELRNNCTVRRVIGTLQAQKAYWTDAVTSLEESIEKCEKSRDLWDFYRVLAISQANLEPPSLTLAIQSAQRSLELAPENQRATVQQLVDQLTVQLSAPESESSETP